MTTCWWLIVQSEMCGWNCQVQKADNFGAENCTSTLSSSNNSVQVETQPTHETFWLNIEKCESTNAMALVHWPTGASG